jgi:hypothetical protein
MNNNKDFLFFLFLTGLVLFLVSEASIWQGQRQARQEAVRVGVAKWVVVDDTGRTEFRWIATQPAEARK